MRTAIGQADAVERLELLAEVGFEGSAVADVGAVGVLEVAELLDQGRFDVLFLDANTLALGGKLVGGLGGDWVSRNSLVAGESGQYRRAP